MSKFRRFEEDPDSKRSFAKDCRGAWSYKSFLIPSKILGISMSSFFYVGIVNKVGISYTFRFTNSAVMTAFLQLLCPGHQF